MKREYQVCVAAVLASLVAAGPAFAEPEAEGDAEAPESETEAEPEAEREGRDEEIDGEIVELEGTVPELGEPAAYELDAELVRLMPGTGGDVLKAVQSMPGAARIPFGLGGLVLRGADPRDTSVYLDSVKVPILYHFGGLASFYPSPLLDELDVTPGGFGAAYGRGQGGLVTVRPRAARRDGWRAGGHVSLLDASAYAEGPTPGGGGLIAGLRRSYIDSILALVLSPDERVLQRYLDGQLRWTHGTPSSGEWMTSIFFSEDRVTAREDRSKFTLSLGFARAAAGYRRYVGDGDTQVRALAWVGGDQLRLRESGGDDEFEARRRVAPAGARAEILRDFERGHLAAGLDLQGARYGVVVIDTEDESFPGEGGARWSGDVGLWTEGRYRIDDGLFGVTPGMRLDYVGLTAEWQLAPRLTITHELDPRLTLRETVGLYHQPPNEIDLFDDEEQALRSSRAAHVAIGGDARLPAAIDLQLTGFFMLGDRQPVGVAPPPDWGVEAPPRSTGGLGPVFQLLLEEQLGSGEYRESVGELRSFGLELGASRRVGPWLAFLSYTLSRSERTDDPDRFVGWRPYELDQTHNLVAMASRRLGRWQLGARVSYATGNPYTPILAVDSIGDRTYGAPLSARIPPHVQLDTRADYHWQPRWGRGTMKAFVDVQNVVNRRNAEGVSHDARGQPVFSRGMPIIPIFGLEYVPPP